MSPRNQSLDVLRGVRLPVFLIALLCLHIFIGDVTARVAGMACLCFWCLFNPLDDRRIKVFFCSLLVLAMSIAIPIVLGLTGVIKAAPIKYDLYLHAIDHTLGFCPASVAVRLLPHSHFLLVKLVIALYQFLPSTMVLGYGWALYRGGQSWRLLLAFVISGFCDFLYSIVPAAGPGFLLGNAVQLPHAAATPGLVSLGYAANCIPSAHLSTAIVIWFFNRGKNFAGYFTLGFIFVTAFATMSLGEHYLVDLAMSFPFAAFIIAAATGRIRRAALFITAVLGWLCAIRFQIDVLLNHPIALWLLIILTIYASCISLRHSAVTSYLRPYKPTQLAPDTIAPSEA